ncbi:MAG: thrombospondin type 3 repeat-containing protein, partial [Myxococcota bacterium]|nr:thrombospondin type 3 repeat-containing protein [Myxococcota bacterium]
MMDRKERTAGCGLAACGAFVLACASVVAGCFHGIREMEVADLRAGNALSAPTWVDGVPTRPPERSFIVSTRDHLRSPDEFHAVHAVREVFRKNIQFEVDYLWDETRDNVCRPGLPGLEARETLDGDDVPVLRRSGICLQVGTPPRGCLAGPCSHSWNIREAYRATEHTRPRWYAPNVAAGGRPVPGVGFQGMDVCYLARLLASLDPVGLAQRPPVYRLRPDLTAAPALVCDPGWVSRWFAAADVTGDGRVTGDTTDLSSLAYDPFGWRMRFGSPERTRYYDLDRDGSFDRGYDYLGMVAALGAAMGVPIRRDVVRWYSELGFGGRITVPPDLLPSGSSAVTLDFAGANCDVTGRCEDGNWVPDQPQEIDLEDMRCQGEPPPVPLGDVRPDGRYDRCRAAGVVDPDDPLQNDGYNGFNCPWQAMGMDTRGRKDFDLSRVAAMGGTVRSQKMHFAPDARQPAFCNRIPGETAPVVGTNRSGFDLSWVNDAGKPALKFDTMIGTSVHIDGAPALEVEITRLRAGIVLTPQTCNEPVGRTCTEWTLVPTDERLDSPRFLWTEARDGVHYGCIEELACGFTGGGCCAADHDIPAFFPDWDLPPGEPAPSLPLALASNNLFFRVGVDASLDYDFEYLWGCDLAFASCATLSLAAAACWAVAAIIPALGPTCHALGALAGISCYGATRCREGRGQAEAEIGRNAGDMRTKFYNLMADIVYWGLDRRRAHVAISGAADPGSPEMAAARHYLHKWFWRPVLPALAEGSAAWDEFTLPVRTLRGIRFTRVEWDGTSRDSVRLSFRWDPDLDDVDDAVGDNCPGYHNPDQADWDGNGVGDVCDFDLDGDHCCMARPSVTPPADYHCACTPAQENAGQCRRNYDLNPRWRSLDSDGDTIADDCDLDRDGDGAANSVDNCPDKANPLQANWDLDWNGNACDPDDDDFEDFECPDWIECPDPPGTERWGYPDPDLACIQGQWRTAVAFNEVDRTVRPLCDFNNDGATDCTGGDVCVWTGWIQLLPGGVAFATYECQAKAVADPEACRRAPLGGSNSSDARWGSPEELCLFEIGGGGSFFDACGLYASSRIPCVANPWRPDCCVACDEAEIYEMTPGGERYRTITPATLGFKQPDMYGMDMAVINDMNANGFRELAVSIPYGSDSAGRPQGTVVLVDGGDGAVLRESPRAGVLGTAIGRLGFRLVATYSDHSPMVVQARGAAALQQVPGAGPSVGMVIYDELGFEAASIAPPSGVLRDPLAVTATSLNVWGREMLALRWPSCNGKIDTGCIRVIDMSGGLYGDLAGRASGDQFGATIDSDGRYGIIGVPGANAGRGEIQVFDFQTNASWRVRNGRYRGIGRAAALVQAPDRPRIVTYAEREEVVARAARRTVPMVIETAVHGQVLDAYELPAGFALVKIVSPMVENRRTTNTYALVFRGATGDIFHVWVQAGGR